MSVGVYIHIPFCLQKCRYCDFPSYAGLDHLHNDYAEALIGEIGQSAIAGAEVDTVYVGGGTPTVLSADMLGRILTVVKHTFSVNPNAEITIEANPGTVDAEKLASLRALGFNRISFGVQAFDNRLLAALGRLHTSAQAVEAVWLAREAGFNNISVDLMYGLPGQTLEDFSSSLSVAVSLGIEHISAYGLTVEEGTSFGRDAEAGLLNLPDEDQETEMYDLKVRFLVERGYVRYEVSNYAKPGFRCRHNLKYWRYEPYAGFGAAACSFWGNERTTNTADVSEYIGRLRDWQSPVAVREPINIETAMAEFIFLGLRTTYGLKLDEFRRRFSRDFSIYYRDSIERLQSDGFIQLYGERMFLTEKGMKYGNTVSCAFLPDRS